MLVADSENYWNDNENYNLRAARADSERMYLGKQIDTSLLFSYQTPYVENQIFANIDAIMSYVVASQPRAEAVPGDTTDQSRALAKDMEKIINIHDNIVNFHDHLNTSTYHAFIYRLGALKLYFDPNYGENGEILVKSINPKDLIVDKNVYKAENPLFICEKHKGTVQRLIYLYPDKKKEILETIAESDDRTVTHEVVWSEVHATVYVKDKPEEWVYVYMKDVLLDKYRDENWIYSDVTQNFLDTPQKPYIPINIYSLGMHWIDDFTLIEQAIPLQNILNKRGRQITENADSQNGLLVFSTDAITADALHNVTGKPNEKILIETKGRPIEEFLMQVEGRNLPPYILDEKIDIRGSIRTVMATPAQLIGTNQTEAGKDETATEAVMVKNQATGRLDRITKSIENAVSQYYKILLQLMTVHYTEKRLYVYNGEDGSFDKIEISRHTIDKKARIFVRPGTTLPFDKGQQQQVALNLAKMGLISPLDLYKDLNMDRPQERYENWVKWKTAPQALSEEAKDSLQDHKALVEYVRVMAGEKVDPDSNADVHHIETHQKQMTSFEFIKKSTAKQRKDLAKLVEAEIKIFQLSHALEANTQATLTDYATGQPVPPQAPPSPPSMPPSPLQTLPLPPAGMPTPPMPGQMPMQQPPLADQPPQNLM